MTVVPAPVPMIDLAREVEHNRVAIESAIMRAVRSGQFVGGAEVDAFEAEVAERLGVRHAVALNSGTDALVLALEGLGIGPGDEVITTPFSFFATVEAIVRVGATPVFADIDLVTLNLDAQAVEAAVTERTKALLPVHLFGLPAPMAALNRIASDHNLKVLEDAAQAFGARYATAAPCRGCDGSCPRDHWQGRCVGDLGDAAAFSFYPTKTLGAYGDAGMVTTSDDALAERVRRLRNHGSRADAKYLHDMFGHNSRLDAVQAAVLRTKLGWLEDYEARRRHVAEGYHAILAGEARVTLPPLHPDHVFHQFTIMLPSADLPRVQAALQDQKIACQRFYPLPLNEQPALAGYDAGDTPHAREAAQRVLSLPIDPLMDDATVDRVAAAVLAALG